MPACGSARRTVPVTLRPAAPRSELKRHSLKGCRMNGQTSEVPTIADLNVSNPVNTAAALNERFP